MPDVKQIEFGQRLRRIDRHDRKLAHGYVASMNHDGLVIASPRKESKGLPLRGLFLTLLIMLTLKGFLYAQLGATAYADRVALLEGGTMIEKIGAYAMKVDPVTLWVSGQIGPFLNK